MIPDDYKFETTFFDDYKIANAFGLEAIKDTYKRAYNDWKDNVVYMKEMTYVLNIMCWHFYEENKIEFSKLYEDLYYECYDKCLDHFKCEDLHEYCEFLD